MLSNIMVPLARLIEQLAGICQVERRWMARVGRHRRRPGMFELQLGLGVVEGHGNRIALYIKRLDAQF